LGRLAISFHFVAVREPFRGDFLVVDARSIELELQHHR